MSRSSPYQCPCELWLIWETAITVCSQNKIRKMITNFDRVTELARVEYDFTLRESRSRNNHRSATKPINQTPNNRWSLNNRHCLILSIFPLNVIYSASAVALFAKTSTESRVRNFNMKHSNIKHQTLFWALHNAWV